MRISELAERSGVPVATLKFYIREGMLPRGVVSTPTSADYGDDHLARLRLIEALAEVRGLPLAKVRDILAIIDAPADGAPGDPIDTMGEAVAALPPYVEAGADHPRARAALETIGFAYDPDYAAVAQLDSAIRAVEGAGLPWDDEVLRRYARAMTDVAGQELAPVPHMAPADAIAYAVLGTALFEPVMLALRRLAHHHLLVEQRDGSREQNASESPPV